MFEASVPAANAQKARPFFVQFIGFPPRPISNIFGVGMTSVKLPPRIADVMETNENRSMPPGQLRWKE